MTDEWAHLSKRDVEPVEFDAMMAVNPPVDPTDPAVIAFHFVGALLDMDTDALTGLVTPESSDSWGDFSSPTARLNAIQDWGLGTSPKRAEGYPQVAYASILRAVPKHFEFTSDEVVPAAAIITLAWRADFGRWMVHAFRSDYFPADQVPTVE